MGEEAPRGVPPKKSDARERAGERRWRASRLSTRSAARGREVRAGERPRGASPTGARGRRPSGELAAPATAAVTHHSAAQTAAPAAAAALAVHPPSAAAAASSAAAAGDDDDAPPQSLQAKLSRPIYDQLSSSFGSSLAGDAAARAKFVSQQGWCGTAWIHAPNAGLHKLRDKEVGAAVALHLSLPLTAFTGKICPCGALLDSAHVDLHASSCVKHPKSSRHEILGRSLDDIFISVGATVERADGGSGGAGVAPYASIQPSQDASPQHVYPDRYITNLPGTSARLVVDHTVVDPQTARYKQKAATEPGHAAAAAHEGKVKKYTPLLQPGDELLIPAFESFGAVHPEFRELLKRLAGVSSGDEEGGGSANIGRKGQLLRAWQIELSMALLQGRLDGLERARRKVCRTEVKKRPQQMWAHSPSARALFLSTRGRRSYPVGGAPGGTGRSIAI